MEQMERSMPWTRCLISSSCQKSTPTVRKKIYHHKSRNGCLVCRSRRVKCDEGRPDCQRCIQRSLQCEYAGMPSRSLPTAIPVTPARVRTFEFPQSQYDFQFYLCAGAPMIAQWYCPSFWLSMLPTTSETSSAIQYALLAMSTTTQQFTSTSAEMIQLVATRGDMYYGRACSKLLPGSSTTTEEALNTSFVLWCYDLGFGRQSQSFVHANAAVKLFQSLEKAQNTSRGSELSREDLDSVLEVGRAFFLDMHFPVGNSEFLTMLERRARNGTKTLYSTPDDFSDTTVHQPSSLFDPFADLATPVHINSFFWLIIVADSIEVLHTIRQALDQCADQCAHDAFPKPKEQEIFETQIRLLQSFCLMYLAVFQDEDHEENDERMSIMLDLIETIMQLIANEDTIPLQGSHSTGMAQQGVHCYLGVLGQIGQKAHSPEIRFRAFSQITSHGKPKLPS